SSPFATDKPHKAAIQPGEMRHALSKSLNQRRALRQASVRRGFNPAGGCLHLSSSQDFLRWPANVYEIWPISSHDSFPEPGWGETPSSANICLSEIRARRSLAPPFMVQRRDSGLVEAFPAAAWNVAARPVRARRHG